ncbi:hypothetical protein KCP77_05005 [Salmonella enterica subsp. enterica]|nr:hypothetical protein KCP77_05005 [Salmonella enterica subsp. enterica]
MKVSQRDHAGCVEPGGRARLHITGVMRRAINAPRGIISEFARVSACHQISTDKIQRRDR